MSEKIEELIHTLHQLKKDQRVSEEYRKELLEKYKSEKDKILTSSEKIMNYLNLVKNELEHCEKNKQDLWRNWEESVLNTKNKKKKSQNDIKKFEFRESHLTELMNSDHYSTIYNIFLSFLIILVSIFVLSQYIENNKIIDFNIILVQSNGVQTLFYYFYFKLLLSISFVVFIQILKDSYQRGSKFLCNTLFYFSLFILLCSFKYMFSTDGMSLFCRMVHYCDNIMMILKLYAYFKEKVAKISYKLYHSRQDNGEIISREEPQEERATSIILKDDGVNDRLVFEFKKVDLLKEIKGFLYFYFAPTLVYRDIYPMKRSTNYLKATKHLIDLTMSLLFTILIVEMEINPMFKDKSFEILENDTIIQTLVVFIIYSFLILFMLFYGIAHSYFNFSAEITKFGDRRFYDCFYATKSPIKFYKKLTLYYEDFLNTYLRNKNIVQFEAIRVIFYCFVFEYIFLNSTGLSCPFISLVIVMSNLISIPFSFFKTQKMVVLNWLIVSLGMGLVVMVNYTEYFVVHSKEWDHNNLRPYRKMIPKIWYILSHNFY